MFAKIGIISKEAHTKSHAKALTDLGHEVLLLGGNPNSYPETLDILVVRPASCSHRATDLAREARNDITMSVVWENSQSKILAAVNKLYPPAPIRLGRKEMLELLGMDTGADCIEAVKAAVDRYGFLFPRIMSMNTKKFLELAKTLDVQPMQPGESGMAFDLVKTWGARTTKNVYRTLVPELTEREGEINADTAYFLHILWWASSKRLCGTIPVITTRELNNNELSILAEMSGLSTEQPKGYKNMSGAASNPDESTTPIRGDHHVGYYHRNRAKWQIRVKGTKKHFESVQGRDAAMLRIMELDEAVVSTLPPEKSSPLLQVAMASPTQKAQRAVEVIPQTPPVPVPVPAPLETEKKMKRCLNHRPKNAN